MTCNCNRKMPESQERDSKMNLFKKLFLRGEPAQGPPVGVGDSEDISDLHVEFCQTFCHRPGVNFIDCLKAEGVDRLVAWLNPATECSLPKGFVRLAVDGTHKGIKIWEVPGITMMYENDGANGGLPSQESLDALSVLAQVLGKPIKLFYYPVPGGDLMVKEWNP